AAPIAAAALRAGAFGLPDNSKDAALLPTLVPGAYSFSVATTGAGGGVGLAEIYRGRSHPVTAVGQRLGPRLRRRRRKPGDRGIHDRGQCAAPDTAPRGRAGADAVRRDG